VKLGIIGGTALESLALEDRRRRTLTTPWGEPSAPLWEGRLRGAQVLFINRHGDDHSIPPHRVNYRANIAALHAEGVAGIVAVNAVGGITRNMLPGTLVSPHQIVDYTWGRSHSYADGPGDPLFHVDFTEPYCPVLRTRLREVAQALGIALVDGAVHGVSQGPRLESAAEIVRMERDGCDLVGMTAMPEAALARERGVPYVSIAIVVNPAAGKSDREITMDDIARVMAGATPNVLRLLEEVCAVLA